MYDGNRYNNMKYRPNFIFFINDEVIIKKVIKK